MSTRERPQLFFADWFGNFDRWSIEEISNDIRHESTVSVESCTASLRCDGGNKFYGFFGKE